MYNTVAVEVPGSDDGSSGACKVVDIRYLGRPLPVTNTGIILKTIQFGTAKENPVCCSSLIGLRI